MTFIPEEPEVPAEQKAEGDVTLRYEDISQTGKLLVDAMPVVLGASIWRAIGAHEASKAMQGEGVIPVLSRLILEGGEGPLPAMSRVTSKGTFELAHTIGSNGEVERIVLNMWCHVVGKAGRTYGPPPPNAGQEILAARVFAEHVLTRPFEPKENRRVTSLNLPGLPKVPRARYTWRAPEAALDLPEGTTLLEDTWKADATHVVFGLDHTDANQHVNSLVYPRLFIEAGLRRLRSLGKTNPLLARRAEVAYRKPSFASESARVYVRAFDGPSGPGVSALLVGEEEAELPIEKMRPRVFARVVFGEG